MDPDLNRMSMSFAPPPPVAEGEEVLLRGDGPGEEGRVFFGVVVEVDEDEGVALVRFGDCTEKWSPLAGLRRLDCDPGPPSQEEDSLEEENYEDSDAPPDLGPPEVDLLPTPQRRDSNASAHHSHGSYPFIPPAPPSVSSSTSAAVEDDDDEDGDIEEVFEDFGVVVDSEEEEEEDDVPLKSLHKKKRRKKEAKSGSAASSRRSSSSSAAAATAAPPKAKRPRRSRKKEALLERLTAEVPKRVLEARKELPYNFDSLSWDDNHLRNEAERYCYCGESGDWYKKMLQCAQCLQWFHQVRFEKLISTGPMNLVSIRLSCLFS